MTTLHLPELHELGLTDLDTEVWVMRTERDGLQPIRVDDMPPRHQAAVLRWIRANAPVLERQQRKLIGHLRADGSISTDEFIRRLNVLDASDPAVWVEDTALVRRLVQLVPTTPRPPRRRRLLPGRLLGGAR